MKKKLFLFSFFILPLCAGNKPIKAPQVVTREQFELNMRNLPEGLKSFVTVFATWSKEDKEKVKIAGLNLYIHGVSKEKQDSFRRDTGSWIDLYLTTQNQRIMFTSCLIYLQQQDLRK